VVTIAKHHHLFSSFRFFLAVYDTNPFRYLWFTLVPYNWFYDCIFTSRFPSEILVTGALSHSCASLPRLTSSRLPIDSLSSPLLARHLLRSPTSPSAPFEFLHRFLNSFQGRVGLSRSYFDASHFFLKLRSPSEWQSWRRNHQNRHSLTQSWSSHPQRQQRMGAMVAPRSTGKSQLTFDSLALIHFPYLPTSELCILSG
jgi:hypothetical protein